MEPNVNYPYYANGAGWYEQAKIILDQASQGNTGGIWRSGYNSFFKNWADKKEDVEGAE